MLEPMSADGEIVRVQLETLKTFRSRIDGVLSTLEASAAAPKTVGKDRVAAGHLGNGFAEADALFATYNHVHDQLETFSGLLSDQIQAMQIAVEGASVGYDHVDLEQRERVWAIHRRTQQYDQQNGLTASPAAADPYASTVTAPQQPQDGSGGISA